MRIEQIIEFKLRGSGPLSHYMYDVLRQLVIFRSTANYFKRQCNLLPPTWAKSHTKYNPKLQEFKRVLYLNCW